MIILIITPRIFYTFYVFLENSKTFPQEIEFSEKNWKDPLKFRLREKLVR